jgi:squalene-hopene/tetraprenyl-beta-curcumene cyclase
MNPGIPFPSNADRSSAGSSPADVPSTAPAALDQAIAEARSALLQQQNADGCFQFELEADCTVPAEYILMMHCTGEVDTALQDKLARFIRRQRTEDQGWPLFPGGEFNLSCSVKCYYALKLAGDDPEAEHMAQTRQLILSAGGAARANVFTRLTLALFAQLPWRGVPFIPVELILLPRWSPFHIGKISYWSRAVMVPLSILYSLKVQAKNPSRTGIRELFLTPPEEERNYFPGRSLLNRTFLAVERSVRLLEPLIPRFIRRRALRQAESWIIERLNGTDGLGAIFPAMVNAHEALIHLGYPAEHVHRQQTKVALRHLVVETESEAYCQPCVSPVWDTALACLTLQETLATSPDPGTEDAIRRGLDWLAARQIQDGPADWRDSRPDLAPGGWPFQFANAHYPDLDDTSAVAWAMHAADAERYGDTLARASTWLAGMQSSNGGFASFDVDNTHSYLNAIPFADHGALLDPPTADVSGRCLLVFKRLQNDAHRQAAARTLKYLCGEQEENGAWFGRWGTNYIYGTWSVLAALEHVEGTQVGPRVGRAAEWLKSVQRDDGSWGEGQETYERPETAGQGPAGTGFQTAWALLGLLAAGAGAAPEVQRGVDYLLQQRQAGGSWNDTCFTAPGFPQVFYLRYHGYTHYFPLWALARYRRHLQTADS